MGRVVCNRNPQTAMDPANTDDMEKVVRSALSSFSLEIVALTLIADEWNTTFRVEAIDGESYSARVYRQDRRSDEEVRAEIAWLEALHRDETIGVPRPLRAADESPFVRVGDRDGYRRVAVFSWVHGERLGDDPPPSLVSAFGEGVARLHEHGRSFEKLNGLRLWDRPILDGGGGVFDAANADIVDRRARTVFERAFAAALETISRLRRAGEPPRIVHGDLHPDNVFVDGERLWFIDFDDCALGWPVQDLGVLMWEVGEDEMTWPYRDAFREGYERVASWPERWPGEINTFAACRGLNKADHGVRTRDVEADANANVQRRADAVAAFLERVGAL
jgi:Ser/Thr protein kinase RdoA (MazF antagonist)